MFLGVSIFIVFFGTVVLILFKLFFCGINNIDNMSKGLLANSIRPDGMKSKRSKKTNELVVRQTNDL
jgi:hypothetical protein